jgi:hypothetical protein
MRPDPEFEKGRSLLKSPINSPADIMDSDEDRGVEAPSIQKEYPQDAKRIELPSPKELSVGKTSLIDAVRNRQSRRTYTDQALTLEEVSFLLWAVQGIRRVGKKAPVTYRTVPASGGIHPLETYLVINRVEGVHKGLYRYLPLEHALLFCGRPVRNGWRSLDMHVGGKHLWLKARWFSSGQRYPIEQNGDTPMKRTSQSHRLRGTSARTSIWQAKRSALERVRFRHTLRGR